MPLPLPRARQDCLPTIPKPILYHRERPKQSRPLGDPQSRWRITGESHVATSSLLSDEPRHRLVTRAFSSNAENAMHLHHVHRVSAFRPSGGFFFF